MTRPLKIISFIVALSAALASGLWLSWSDLKPLPPTPPEIAGIYIQPPIALDPFQLIQQSGDPLTANDFKGQWNLLFFGFTHCPDVCPTALQQMNVMDQQLKTQKRAEKVSYWFISVDPQRDTPQRLAEYVSFFNADFRAATGPTTELDKLARKFGVYYNVEPPSETHDDYRVEHSGAIMILNPQGEYQAVFTDPDGNTPAKLATDFIEIVDFWTRNT